jgi:hypothetical protein
MRLVSVFALLLVSCEAERGADLGPSLDGGEADQREEPAVVDAGPADVTIDRTDAAPDRGWSWTPDDALVHWDYQGEPWTINIWDAQGPDGSCVILPGPWVRQEGECFVCIYPEPHPICACIFERYAEGFPRCPLDAGASATDSSKN